MAQPIGMSWEDLAALQFDLGQFGNASGFNSTGLRNSFTNLAKTIGYDGSPLQNTTFNSTYEGESGPVNQQMQGQAVSPDLLKALQNYRYTTEKTGDGRVNLGVFGQDGSQVGSYLHGTKDSGFDQFAYKAIPLGIAALGGAALGGFIPGAEIGAAGGASGAGGVASTIGAGEGAAQLAAYQAANPLTAAGVTASTLPAAGLPGLGGAAAAGGLIGAGEGAAQLGAYTAANPLTAAEVTASTLPAAGLPGLSSGLLGPAAAWMKANPVMGRLLTAGATGLLSTAGGGSGGSSGAVPTGPAKQWTSPLQQGLLSQPQQYAPPAIAQNQPAGLLAQGQQNDGAWRYLKG